jgi:hypothetical protein
VDWSVWQDIGFLQGGEYDFPYAHPNFQLCFKPGNYVAKCRFNDPQGQGKIHWMFSQDLSLAGKYGSNRVTADESYVHYSIFYNEETLEETGSGEHLTILPDVRIYFRQIPIKNVKGSTREEKLVNSWNDMIRNYIPLQKDIKKYLL